MLLAPRVRNKLQPFLRELVDCLLESEFLEFFESGFESFRASEDFLLDCGCLPVSRDALRDCFDDDLTLVSDNFADELSCFSRDGRGDLRSFPGSSRGMVLVFSDTLESKEFSASFTELSLCSPDNLECRLLECLFEETLDPRCSLLNLRSEILSRDGLFLGKEFFESRESECRDMLLISAADSFLLLPQTSGDMS